MILNENKFLKFSNAESERTKENERSILQVLAINVSKKKEPSTNVK